MNGPVTIQAPDTAPLSAELSPIIREAADLVVDSQASHGTALELAKRAAAGVKAFEEMLDPSIKLANAAHKSLTSLRSTLTAPFEQARRILTAKALGYEQAERQRVDEERRRKEAEAKKAEEDRQLADAIAAAESGDTATADAIMAEPTPTPVVHVAPAVAKVAGTSIRTTWDAEVVDFMALVRYVAANPGWQCLLQPNTSELRSRAKSQKEHLSIPGVRAVSTADYAVRAG